MKRRTGEQLAFDLRRVRRCTRCGVNIVLEEVVVDSHRIRAVYSEYCDAEGYCWNCKDRRPRAHREV